MREAVPAFSARVLLSSFLAPCSDGTAPGGQPHTLELLRGDQMAAVRIPSNGQCPPITLPVQPAQTAR
jgi:hypothetical protein